MYIFSPSKINAAFPEARDLEDLLNHLKHVQKIDLTGYKRPHLSRRIQVRMHRVGAECCQDYIELLTQQPDEVTHLLSTIFVNYTSFFRDRSVWCSLETEVIPQLIAKKAPDEPIRIWSAGCASGEETYSLAILFAEALGIKQFQQRVQIYGTDIDADALLQARQGCYSAQAVSTIPPDLVECYFDNTAKGYCWRQDLSQAITFRHHDLTQASPLRDIDLIVCRNTLMYLTSEAQIRALFQLHASLNLHGFLLLGWAERLVTRLQQSFFTLTYPEARIFTKVLDTERDRQDFSISVGETSVVNDSLMKERETKSPVNLVPEQSEQQRFQVEMMRYEIEWLQEQVRSLQDKLADRIQQQQTVEQELQATHQELKLMNQEMQRWIQARCEH